MDNGHGHESKEHIKQPDDDHSNDVELSDEEDITFCGSKELPNGQGASANRSSKVAIILYSLFDSIFIFNSLKKFE